MALTAAQRLLLRAALLEGDAAREAWEAWRRQSDVETLDPGSQRLLPQLYRNARVFAQADPLLERLKGVYRHSWSANGVLLHEAGRLLTALARADIQALVLDGVALVTSFYRDQGARAVDSIVIMIEPEDVPRAIRALSARDWEVREGQRSSPSLRHTSQMRVGGPRPVDLLWDPFPEGCDPELRRTCWTYAEPAMVGDVACHRLAPTEELLRTCVRAARWDVLPAFRRLADALVLLRAAGPHLDWERLAHQAVRARVVLPVRASLSLLREVLDAPVPEGTLRHLQDASVGAGDWLEQRLSERPHGRLGRLPDLLFRYRRLAGVKEGGVAEAGLPRYLQDAWGVGRRRQLPIVVLGKAIRRVLRRPQASA